MLLTDGIHLVSDESLAELHWFARSIGLKLEWFQDKKLPHYDLTTARKRRLAKMSGAVTVSSQELVKRMVRQKGVKN